MSEPLILAGCRSASSEAPPIRVCEPATLDSRCVGMPIRDARGTVAAAAGLREPDHPQAGSRAAGWAARWGCMPWGCSRK